MSDAIGIDIGYGFTKTFTIKNGIPEMKVFSTIVSSYIPDFSFGTKIPTIMVNGSKFSIGEDLVLNGIPYENTTRQDFVGSPSYMAILGYTLYHTDFHGKIMVLGLPPSFYHKERTKELTEKIRKQWFVDESGKPIIVPEIIKFVPQGAGIFFNCVALYPGIFKKNVVVIDIGYYTLDMIFFSLGKYVEGTALSTPLGIKRLYDDIRKEFAKVYGIFAKDDESIEELIGLGKYTHLGEEYKLDVSNIIRSYRNMVFTTIKGHIEKVIKKIDYAFMGGGGVRHLQGIINGINIIENPQFANAAGFYLYGKQFLEN